MANDENPFEGQKFRVLGFGRQEDARINLPSGKTCFVSGVPKGQTEIEITGYRPGAGRADFASYQPPTTGESRTQEPTPASRPAQTARPAATPTVQDVYLAHIGPTSRADDCAIAVCNPTVLDMPAYDALVQLIRQNQDKGVFTDSTDRRIARGLYDTYERAHGDDALEEVIMTLDGQPVNKGTTRKFRQYFRIHKGKHRAQATIAEGDGKPTAAEVAQPKKPTVYRAPATVARKGSPGNLEYMVQ
jgi:hypothetical protein